MNTTYRNRPSSSPTRRGAWATWVLVSVGAIAVACTSGPSLESRLVDRSTDPARETWREVERFVLTHPGGPKLPIDCEITADGHLAVLDADGPSVWMVTPRGLIASTWPISGVDFTRFFRPRVLFANGLSVNVMDPDERLVLSFDAKGRYEGVALDFSADAVVGELGFFRPVDADADDAGRVFVTDGEGDRVLVFGPGGEFLFSFGAFGSGLGQLRNPGALTVADDGRVHVCDVGNRRIQHFDGFGTPVGVTGNPDDPKWVPQAVTSTPRGDVLVLARSGSVSRVVGGRLVALAESPADTERIEASSGGLMYWLSVERRRVIAVEAEGL